MTLFRRQGSRPSPQKKCKKAKWFSEEAIQIAEKRIEAKSNEAKERYTYLNAEFQRLAKRERQPSSMISANRGKQQNGKDERSLQEN